MSARTDSTVSRQAAFPPGSAACRFSGRVSGETPETRCDHGISGPHDEVSRFSGKSPSVAKPWSASDRTKAVENGHEIDDIDGFVQELTGCQDDLIVFIRALCGDYHLAADIRQEVNMVLWRKRGMFAPGTSFRKWAYRIAHLEVKEHFRRIKRRQTTTMEPDLIDCFAAELPATVGELPERRKALAACMERLTPKDHELIQHRYWSEGTLESLATATGRSVGTLKARLFQLRTALRLCIRERLTHSTP